MRAGIDAEDEKRRIKKEEDDSEVQQRLERNRKEFELQQQLTKTLLAEK